MYASACIFVYLSACLWVALCVSLSRNARCHAEGRRPQEIMETDPNPPSSQGVQKRLFGVAPRWTRSVPAVVARMVRPADAIELGGQGITLLVS